MLSTYQLYNYNQELIIQENFIQDLKERFSNPKVVESIDKKLDKVQDKTKNLLNNLERKLKSHNINTAEIKQIINSESKKIISNVKTLSNDPKKAGQYLAEEYRNLNKKIFAKISSLSTGKGILFSIGLFILVGIHK